MKTRNYKQITQKIAELVSDLKSLMHGRSLGDLTDKEISERQSLIDEIKSLQGDLRGNTA